jgi:hypothetical protein
MQASLEPPLNNLCQHQGFGLISPEFLGSLFFISFAEDHCGSLYKTFSGHFWAIL